MDITQIILDQHAQQRALFAQLEEFPRDDVEGLGLLWKRLQVFLEIHAEAEERHVYPTLLTLGSGQSDADDGTVEGEVEDDIKDHNDLRTAVRKAASLEVGSKEWWEAVTEANVANSNHMGEEERQDLTDLRRHASLQVRHDMAVAFLRFQAETAAQGVSPVDKDPQRYAEDAGAEMRRTEQVDVESLA